MTRIHKSDAQLDAEAEARKPDPTPQDIYQRIVDHRLMYAAEIPVRINQAHVPSSLEDIAEHVQVNGEWVPTGVTTAALDAGPLGGPSLSSAMAGRLSTPPATTQYWVRARYALHHDRCRRTHPEHWSAGVIGMRGVDLWRGSLCDRLVYLTVIERRDYLRTCYELHVKPGRTAKVMDGALGFIETHMARARKIDAERAAARVGGTADALEGKITYTDIIPAPAHVHQAQPGLHQLECPQCRRRSEAA